MAAIDNIDHNPSSSTAQASFHGTSISIFQYPKKSEIQPCFEYHTPDISYQGMPTLPESYTQLLPTKYLKPEPTNREPYRIEAVFQETLSGIAEWIEGLGQFHLKDNIKDQISFSAFYVKKTRFKMPKTISTLLPLLNESINSTTMVRHCMSIKRTWYTHQLSLSLH